MSDLMRLIPYRQLLNWSVCEWEKEGSIFGVSKLLKRSGRRYPIFDGSIGTLFGPAAGPNTQLAQNLVAAYLAGSSWFELKTVQKMDGRELAACVPKPCIAAEDECYNCEWSTELEVGQAYEEYVKAWVLIHILATELGLGSPDDIVFNMSVGYDLDGIKTPKLQKFLDEMIEAKENPVFCDCINASLEAVEKGLLKKVTKEDILKIPSQISNSVTESTLHGCPPEEIEAIASYLMKEKHLNTYVKCNPTLLGYDFARKTLDGLGFDYIAFDDHHFTTDLQWADAVPMFERLTALAKSLGLSIGIKLTNTFPVDVKAGELPSEEMYMSGRSLYPLTIQLVSRIAKQFDGKLRISYSGGADYFNIRDLVTAGVWPVTMATTLLKPGGYQRLYQIGTLLEDIPDGAWTGVDTEKVSALAEEALVREKNRKSIKPLPSRKKEESLPLMDCFDAPCSGGCPIHQDIPAYLRAMEEGRSADALRIILEKNALPFITGTICPHTCADRCMRNHYEESVRIREVKLEAAKSAAADLLAGDNVPASRKDSGKTAIVGGGPAGLAAASFLSRAGVPVTVFEKEDTLGGVVRRAIPQFRIDDSAIDRDIELCARYGAQFRTGCEITDLASLRKEGYTDIILAIGAWKHGRNALSYGESLDALDFLTKVKKDESLVSLGEKVVVIGAGNTAMDVSRAALRVRGVKEVSLVYRRTRRYMPADEEELLDAIRDGVTFRELLAPIGWKDGRLECSVMTLGEPDEGGRRSPVDTGEKIFIDCDSVITAVGERVDYSLLEGAGAAFDEKGRPVTDENNRTSVEGVYLIGDCRRGPATVVKGIADAMTAASAIAGITFDAYEKENGADDVAKCKERKGVLSEGGQLPEKRCLGCATVCEVCTDVCPNRANIAIRVPGLEKEQILHVDGMCNECGNCAVFCPYSGRPYRDKLTLFWSEEDMENSGNTGFLVLGGTKVRLRFAEKTQTVDVSDEGCGLHEPLRLLILAVIREYSWLIGQS